MTEPSTRTHWQQVWSDKAPEDTSWFEARPTWSAEHVLRLLSAPDGTVVDAGGGASSLVDLLLDAGCRDVVVLDVAADALDVARRRLGPRADEVTWLVGDVLEVDLPADVAVWHDRAVLHFLHDDADRRRYAQRVAAAVRPGGHAVVAGFGPDGPTHCSGLEVRRASAEDLAALFAPAFEAVEQGSFVHTTPWGAEQAFAFVVLRRGGAGNAA